MKPVRNVRLLLLVIGLCLNILTGWSQQTAEKFVQETQYLLSLPDNYNADTAKRWPLLIFLHGSGESGDDLSKVKKHGPPKLAEQGKKFPFIIVSPQCRPGVDWEPENLYRFIRYIKKTQRVDDKRIYLTGLSMGGFGTWALAMKYPGEFAAIAPVCGGGDTTNAWKLRNMAIWNFHGAKDDQVLPVQSDNMIKAVRRNNPSAKYTLYPDANHNSWDTTYNNDSLYEWMLSKTKFQYKEVAMSPDLFKQFTGRYVSPEKDTVVISASEHNLVAQPGNDKIPLRAAGNDLFFLEPLEPADIRFIREKGVVQSFLFMGNRRIVYKKIL